MISKILMKIEIPVCYSMISETDNSGNWFFNSTQFILRLSLLCKYFHLIQAMHIYLFALPTASATVLIFIMSSQKVSVISWKF